MSEKPYYKRITTDLRGDWIMDKHFQEVHEEKDKLIKECPHKRKPKEGDFKHPGYSCLHVDVIGPSDHYCVLMPKEITIKRNICPGRWILSGGDPVSILHPCTMRVCPLFVEAEYSNMSFTRRGFCPRCHKINSREWYGWVTCEECELEYYLAEHGSYNYKRHFEHTGYEGKTEEVAK